MDFIEYYKKQLLKAASRNIGDDDFRNALFELHMAKYYRQNGGESMHKAYKTNFAPHICNTKKFIDGWQVDMVAYWKWRGFTIHEEEHTGMSMVLAKMTKKTITISIAPDMQENVLPYIRIVLAAMLYCFINGDDEVVVGALAINDSIRQFVADVLICDDLFAKVKDDGPDLWLGEIFGVHPDLIQDKRRAYSTYE